MGPKTSGNGQIQKREQTAPAKPGDNSLAGLLVRMGPEIERALPKHLDPERMARIALTALRTVPKLAACTPTSFMGCLLQTAQLGLEPNTPMQHAWLIPRENRKQKRTDCTLMVGYQGYIELAMRSGRVTGIYAFVVRKGDDFRVQLGLSPDIHHVPSDAADREKQPITYVYAVAKIKNGEPIFVCLSRAQVEARRDRSEAYKYNKSGPWSTDEEPMFKKTAVRALWPWLPKSAEMAAADAAETAADLGKPHSGFDDSVVDMLQGQGLELPIDAEGEDVDHDPETGEVKPAAAAAAEVTPEPKTEPAVEPDPNDQGDGNGQLSAAQEAALLGGGK
jgi:recombination protein RecT